MSELGQHLLFGLSAGSVYGLLGLGLVLVYRVCRVVTFAHGTAATLAVYVAYQAQPLGLTLALLIGIGAAFVFGVLTERLVSRVQRGGHNAELLVTLALFMLGDGLFSAVFGADLRPFRHVFTYVGEGHLAPWLPLTFADAVILGVALVSAALLALFVRRTRTGLVVRALGDNPEAAERLGLPVAEVRALTWGLSSALGGVAGLLIVPRLFLDPGMMFTPLLKAFAAAVLGGFGSMLGVLIGGALLGVSEVLVGAYLSTTLQSSLGFIVLLVALLIRPEGLLARPQRRRL